MEYKSFQRHSPHTQQYQVRNFDQSTSPNQLVFQHPWEAAIQTLDHQHRINFLKSLNKKDFRLYKQLGQSCFFLQKLEEAVNFSIQAVSKGLGQMQDQQQKHQQSVKQKQTYYFKQCHQSMKIAVESLLKIKNPHFYLVEKTQKVLSKLKQTPQFSILTNKLDELIKNNKITAFLSQLRQNGAQLSRIDLVQQQAQYRKVVSIQKIERDQVIIFIPKKFLITLQMTKASALVRRIYEQKVNLCSPKHCLLSIFLLEHKQLGPSSPHFRYIQLLPKKYQTFPINYNREELSQLEGSPFLDQVEQKIQDLRKDYETICRVGENVSSNQNINQSSDSQFPSYPRIKTVSRNNKHTESVDQTWHRVIQQKCFRRFSFQQFEWARMTIASRIFGIVINNCKTDALVPLADMLNHQSPKQTNWYYSDADQGFIIRNLKVTNANNQIFDSYGQKCNSRFLLNYGFTSLNNPANEVIFTIATKAQVNENNEDKAENIQHQNSVVEDKNEVDMINQQIVSPISQINSVRRSKSNRRSGQSDIRLDYDQIPKQLYVRANKIIMSKQFDEFVGVFRYSCMTAEQLKTLRQGNSLQKYQVTKFISLSNQLQVWKKVEETSAQQLSLYPTTFKEDKKLIASHLNGCQKLPINVFNCVVLRMGQKEVLQFYQTMSKKMQKFLKTEIEKNKIRMNNPKKQKQLTIANDLKTFQSYIRSLPIFQ